MGYIDGVSKTKRGCEMEKIICPECESTGPIEDNNCKGDDLSFVCLKCGEQWDAVSM